MTRSRERGQRPYQARALRLLGEVSARRDAPEHAHGRYRDALALAEELEMRPLVARCHLGLGTLARRAGSRPLAEDHVAAATAMFHEMGMPFWLAQAESAAGSQE